MGETPAVGIGDHLERVRNWQRDQNTGAPQGGNFFTRMDIPHNLRTVVFVAFPAVIISFLGYTMMSSNSTEQCSCADGGIPGKRRR